MKRCGGFTLIELVMIISLLGIMVVLYIESAGNVSDLAVDAASKKVQQDLRYAQQLAQTTGVNHGGSFTAQGSYEIYSGSPGNPVLDPTTKQNMVDDLSKFPGVSISGSKQFEFNSIGKPVIGGGDHMTLSASSGAVRDIYVIDETGAVIVDIFQTGGGCGCEFCY